MKSYTFVRQKRTTQIVLAVLLCVVTSALAKRLAPKPVRPIVKDGIEYSAPLSREGFVIATWIKTGREIWSRQVYVIKHEYKRGLEEDVQTCFITDVRFENGKLRVINERDGEFEIDPETLTVTPLKGRPVIDYSNFKP